MIKDKSEMPARKLEIDLSGPQGNAFVLLGYCSKLGKALHMSNNQITNIKLDMMSSDYEHLVEVFDKHFGDQVILYR